MPEATDWQALDARIAREVMEYYTWDGLTAKHHEEPPPEPINPWWWADGEDGATIVVQMRHWQPHKDVAQALAALEVLRAKGHDTSIDQKAGGPRCWVTIWSKNAPRHIVEIHDLLPKAICLALESWLDAHKEKQDDPG